MLNRGFARSQELLHRLDFAHALPALTFEVLFLEVLHGHRLGLHKLGVGCVDVNFLHVLRVLREYLYSIFRVQRQLVLVHRPDVARNVQWEDDRVFLCEDFGVVF